MTRSGTWLALLLMGCTTAEGRRIGDRPPPTLGEAPPTAEDGKAEDAYQDVLDRYSRRAELYTGPERGEDTRMFTAATYQSLPFREARVRRLGGVSLGAGRRAGHGPRAGALRGRTVR